MAVRSRPVRAAQHHGRRRALIVDDDEGCLQLSREILSELEGLETRGALDQEEALRIVSVWRPQLVLLDLIMPGVEGFGLLDRVQALAPETDVILVTGCYATGTVVEAIQRGANDYLTKPIPPTVLLARVRQWLAEAEARIPADLPEEELAEKFRRIGVVGRSPRMIETYSKVLRVAPYFQTVLLRGATGTGKEVVARALHCLSGRPNAPFVSCNAAALPETLVESELFGYVRGAFTGAHQDRVGLVEAADGGTLFLDEIGDIPAATQFKLLRVLQNREVQRVGSTHARQVDVRVVAATNRDLRQMVASGAFREDLYYRLAAVELQLPSLAERREDIPLLRRYFLEKHRAVCDKPNLRFSRKVEAQLERYGWPGNVRQLENVVGYCCMVAERDVIEMRHLPDWMRDALPVSARSGGSDLSIDELVWQHVREVLERYDGNRARAARVLGISRATLYRILERRGWGDSREEAPPELQDSLSALAGKLLRFPIKTK